MSDLLAKADAAAMALLEAIAQDAKEVGEGGEPAPLTMTERVKAFEAATEYVRWRNGAPAKPEPAKSPVARMRERLDNERNPAARGRGGARAPDLTVIADPDKPY
jgi:hypothetical protein